MRTEMIHGALVVVYTVEDVKRIAPWVNESQALLVLDKTLEIQMDGVGISIEDIHTAVDMLYPEPNGFSDEDE